MWLTSTVSAARVRCTRFLLQEVAWGIGCLLQLDFAELQDVSSLNLAASSGAAIFLSWVDVGYGSMTAYLPCTAPLELTDDRSNPAGGALRDAVMALHREWLQVIWNAAIRRRPMTIFGIDVAVSLARRSHSVGVGSGQCVKVSALRFLPLRVAAC